jgi:hypothetical protein
LLTSARGILIDGLRRAGRLLKPAAPSTLPELALLLGMLLGHALLLRGAGRLNWLFVRRVPRDLSPADLAWFLPWLLAAIGGWLFVRPRTLRGAAPWIGLVTALAFLTPPFLTSDPYAYVASSRVLTVHGRDPYDVALRDLAPADPFAGYSPWDRRVALYGPLLVLVQTPLGWASSAALALRGPLDPPPVMLPIMALKIALLAVHLLNLAVIARIQRRRGLDEPGTARAVWLYAAHPLILLDGLVNAHNDMVVTLLLLLSVLALETGRWLRGYLFTLASVTCKFTTATLLPVYGWLALRNRRPRAIAAMLLLGMAVLGALGAFIQAHPPYREFLFEMSGAVHGSVPAYLGMRPAEAGAAKAPRAAHLLGLVLAAAASGAWILLAKGASPALPALVTVQMIGHYCSPYVYPWYAIPTAALAILLAPGVLRATALALSIALAAAYVLDFLPRGEMAWDVGLQFAVPLAVLVGTLFRRLPRRTPLAGTPGR